MAALPYALTGPIGSRASLGLIVLQADEVLEQDFRRLFPAGDVAIHTTRIPSGADLTPETLAAMEAELPRAASLLPPSVRFDAIGYACTSGATVIGAAKVAALVGAVTPGPVTDPLSATIAACARLGITRIGLISPYVEDVSAALRAALQDAGIAIAAFASFEERVEARVARIDPASIHAATLSIGAEPGVEAVFLSCTNLRTLDILEGAERALGKPVLSSNQALAWRMAEMAGIAPPAPVGRLMAATRS
ncbi:MAG: maleate isomerase [Paracoccaceae bacterium]|jgi:maleate isomerase